MLTTRKFVSWFGSLRMAVILIIVIAAVLSWGTLYEVRYGTAAVQRFIYTAWWFELLLGFLGLNLATVAIQRRPWKKKHIPFLAAHLGIILILIGGILSGRLGVDGQLIIREGETERTLLLPGKLLTAHQPNPGSLQFIPTNFETRAWVQEPNFNWSILLDGRSVELTVDKYYPNAILNERIEGGGEVENPAIRLLLSKPMIQDTVWLLSRDPERFGIGWDEGHLLFLEPETEAQAKELLEPSSKDAKHSRGVVGIRFKNKRDVFEIPVPEELKGSQRIPGTSYRVAFKDYFPDFVIGPNGLMTQSLSPNNPAISLVLSGPEGEDPYLLFALHPEFQEMHGFGHTIDAELTYTHQAGHILPPNAIVLIRNPSGTLSAVLTGRAGERDVIKALEVGKAYEQPWLETTFTVDVYYPKARVEQEVTNRGDTVRAEAIHVIVTDEDRSEEAWIGLEQSVELFDGEDPLILEYRHAREDLPVSIKLIDFRKIDYPGTQMAAGFESDVQLIDKERGMILLRTISMNKPLKHRGYSFFQSSFIPGAVETTILSVRKDPGTPVVYTGCLLLVLGIIGMFVSRSDWARNRKTRRKASGAKGR